MFDVSNFPTYIIFKISGSGATDSNCPTNFQLTFGKPNTDLMKSALSLLVSAQLSGRTIYLTYDPTSVFWGQLASNACAIDWVALH